MVAAGVRTLPEWAERLDGRAEDAGGLRRGRRRITASVRQESPVVGRVSRGDVRIRRRVPRVASESEGRLSRARSTNGRYEWARAPQTSTGDRQPDPRYRSYCPRRRRGAPAI